MIDAFFENRDRKELELLCRETQDIAARLSEDGWNFYRFADQKKAMAFLNENRDYDLACVDVEGADGLSVAVQTRSGSDRAFIVIVADAARSPMDYLRPEIMPGALLLRPIGTQQLKQVMRSSVEALLREREQDRGPAFRLQQQGGDKLIPYSRICYFEARNKKIVLCTEDREYTFSGTIDGLQAELGQGFVRCHRSFLVSRSRIDRIYLSRNYSVLTNGMEIPLSRSFKQVLKELR